MRNAQFVIRNEEREAFRLPADESMESDCGIIPLRPLHKIGLYAKNAGANSNFECLREKSSKEENDHT